jgi:hypothetical protein
MESEMTQQRVMAHYWQSLDVLSLGAATLLKGPDAKAKVKSEARACGERGDYRRKRACIGLLLYLRAKEKGLVC